MLHFETRSAKSRKTTPRYARWRLWMLFVAACSVLWCMRMLQSPEIAQRIDTVFTPDRERQAVNVPDGNIELTEETTLLAAPGSAGGSAKSRRSQRSISNEYLTKPPAEPGATEPSTEAEARNANESPASRFDLSEVRDNTYFRAQENAAWFAVWDYLQQSTPGEVASDSLGEVTYAQLIEQPEVYRGQSVTIQGTAMREESLDAPENQIGIENYHRLIIRPKGGGVWPIVVYCLRLPPDFPTGDQLRADVKVTGIFFKNWSYSWEGGLGLAPVVLTNRFDWQPPPVIERRTTEFALDNIVAALVLSGGLAILLGWFAWRQTRRPMTPIGGPEIVISPPLEAER